VILVRASTSFHDPSDATSDSLIAYWPFEKRAVQMNVSGVAVDVRAIVELIAVVGV